MARNDPVKAGALECARTRAFGLISAVAICAVGIVVGFLARARGQCLLRVASGVLLRVGLRRIHIARNRESRGEPFPWPTHSLHAVSSPLPFLGTAPCLSVLATAQTNTKDERAPHT
jgi:hypothetical protein